MADGEEGKVLEMTPELQERLAAYKPIPVDANFSYVPKVYRDVYPNDKSKWPVFKLKYLTGIEKVCAEDSLLGKIRSQVFLSGDEGSEDDISKGISVNRGAFVRHVCSIGILGWRNYDISFEGKQSIEQLPSALLYELTNAVTECRTLSEDELRGLE